MTVISEESRRSFLFIGFASGKVMGISTKSLDTIFVIEAFLTPIKNINIIADNINTVHLLVTSEYGDITGL